MAMGLAGPSYTRRSFKDVVGLRVSLVWAYKPHVEQNAIKCARIFELMKGCLS